jgi:phosphoribosylaminoimidazolecarboxamide formyltransferase/IMP cyclohydrolase
MLDGRVKTLHPNVFAGILANRAIPEHMSKIAEYGISPIDVVVVNLYDFEGNPDIEQIDIGGPSLIRAAGKNGARVVVVVDPADYDKVIAEVQVTGGLSRRTRELLVIKAFTMTALYDRVISDWMREKHRRDVPFLESTAPTSH